jgi:hypothetical protein
MVAIQESNRDVAHSSALWCEMLLSAALSADWLQDGNPESTGLTM